jgi:hypothetical protein
MEPERLFVCLEQDNTIYLTDQCHADSEPSKGSTNYNSKEDYISFFLYSIGMIKYNCHMIKKNAWWL